VMSLDLTAIDYGDLQTTVKIWIVFAVVLLQFLFVIT
jgi:hypothetical protein